MDHLQTTEPGATVVPPAADNAPVPGDVVLEMAAEAETAVEAFNG